MGWVLTCRVPTVFIKACLAVAGLARSERGVLSTLLPTCMRNCQNILLLGVGLGLSEP